MGIVDTVVMSEDIGRQLSKLKALDPNMRRLTENRTGA